MLKLENPIRSFGYKKKKTNNFKLPCIPWRLTFKLSIKLRDHYVLYYVLYFGISLDVLDLLGLSHASDLKTGSQVATLPGAWRYRVSAGTGWPGVGILWRDEMERLICNFYLGVVARKIVWADLSLRFFACCWDIENNVLHSRSQLY